MTVEDVMRRDVITVSPATPIHEAASLMVEHRVSGLPVIDAEGRLVGIISDGDLIVRPRRRKRTPYGASRSPRRSLSATHAARDAARVLLARSAEWTIRNSPTFSIVRTPTSS